jgi:hypothetical protein
MAKRVSMRMHERILCKQILKVWKVFNEIADGFSGYFKKSVTKQFDRGYGQNAKMDIENAHIASTHYQKLFHLEDVTPDFTVLDKIKPLATPPKIKDAIKSPPSGEDVVRAIKKLKPRTTSGTTGISADMLRAVPASAHSYIIHVILQCWKGENDPA